MAQGEARLIVKLVDQATAGLNTLKDGINVLKQHWLLLTATIGTMTAFLASSVRAFAEQEVAVSKLNNALKNQGITSASVSRDIQNYALELQKITAFSDEAIIQGQALLVTFGLTGDELKQATSAALDFSSALGIDLHTAMLLVGKAAIGETATLARYGIKINEGTADSEKFSAIMKQLNNMFGGAAQAQAGTFTGQMSQFSNAFNDLQERVGQMLAGDLSNLVAWMKSLIVLLDKLISKWKEYNLTLDINKAAHRATTSAFKSIIDAGLGLIGVTKTTVKNESDAAEMRDFLSKQRRAQIHEETEKFIEKKRQEVSEYGLSESDKAVLQQEADAVKLEQSGAFDLANQTRINAQDAWEKAQQDRKKNEKESANSEMIASTKRAFSGVLALNIQHNKELIAIQKTAGIAMVIIDTAEAIMNVWRWASRIPFAGAAIAAGLTGMLAATGAAQIAAISGAKLAEGGVVMPRSGGIQATIGEAKQAEAVIPLGDSRATDMIRESIGGQITINLYAQWADRTAFQEFVDKIDEEMFRRGRNGKGYS